MPEYRQLITQVQEIWEECRGRRAVKRG
jgi:hypothetical protein